MKNTIFAYFPVCKGLSNDDVRGQGAPYFISYGRELVSKTSDFVKEKLGVLPKRTSPAVA